MTRLLFVCTGNICRSPTAEGVARTRSETAGLGWHVESAGIGAWHVGEAPDERSIAAADRCGIDLSDQQARQVEPGDFARFDHIIALDRGHLRALRRMPAAGSGARLSLLLDWLPGMEGEDVPDPYYGNTDGFSRVFDLIDAAIAGLQAGLAGSRT